ncbi:MAG: insulinase family protein [Myxococcota bacterium]|nr:insulinase family protein [Deltaproteobacteria bacterium]MDQ3336519.1 insulinase family protein [Myxococcota bacterium]
MIRFDGDLPHLETRRRTLPCGLDVVLHRDEQVPQVAVNVWYRVGSSDERADRTGFAHLFEHLFKSPPHRLGGHHHYDVLRRAGATEANASTSTDRTAYHEVMPSHELETALWIEADRMGYFARDFDEERLVMQQSVVRSERRQRYEDVPYGAERFAVAAALYPDGHPLRYLTIGRHEHIQAATFDDVIAFYRTWYVPANATLVIAGDIDPDTIDASLDRFFSKFPASQRPARALAPAPAPARVATTVTDTFAALPRIHRAWLGPGAFAADEPELDVLTTAWSSVGTGALWRRLVYETQLAQRVAAWTVNGRLGGEVHVALDLRTGADPVLARAVLDEECAKGIDERAIQRAVTRREAGAIWSLTGLSRRANILQRYVMYTDEPDGLANELARYRAVTPSSIDRALARWLDPAHMIEVETVPAMKR